MKDLLSTMTVFIWQLVEAVSPIDAGAKIAWHYSLPYAFCVFVDQYCTSFLYCSAHTGVKLGPPSENMQTDSTRLVCPSNHGYRQRIFL